MSSSHPRAHWLLFRMLSMALLASSLAGCASVQRPAPVATATPRPTATVAPRTLYQADWLHHASEWKLAPDWSIVNGKLQNNGKGTASLVIPYQVTDANYTVTFHARIITVKNPGACGNEFGLVSQTPGGKLLYTSIVSCIEHNLHAFSLVYPADPADSNLANDTETEDYTPGINPQPYVTQAQGTYISYTPGSFIGTVQSAQPLVPARLLLIDQDVQLEVEDLTITTP